MKQFLLVLLLVAILLSLAVTVATANEGQEGAVSYRYTWENSPPCAGAGERIDFIYDTHIVFHWWFDVITANRPVVHHKWHFNTVGYGIGQTTGAEYTMHQTGNENFKTPLEGEQAETTMEIVRHTNVIRAGDGVVCQGKLLYRTTINAIGETVSFKDVDIRWWQ